MFNKKFMMLKSHDGKFYFAKNSVFPSGNLAYPVPDLVERMSARWKVN